MIAASIFLLAGLLQNPIVLEVGVPFKGQIATDARPVHTPTLDTGYSVAPTVGGGFNISIPDSGSYFIELYSWDFDGYLVLLDSNREIIAEDDDGLIATHSRIVFDSIGEGRYEVLACALHGRKGEFELALYSGKPKQNTMTETWTLELNDWRKRALHIERTDGVENKDLAWSLSRVGYYLHLLGNYHGAEVNYFRALKIREKIFGPEHSAIASSLLNIGSLYRDMVRLEEAEKYCRRSLEIREVVFGPEHPSVAVSLSELGLALSYLGKHEEARLLFERALLIREKRFGPTHLTTSLSLTHLAMSHQDLGNYQEARELLERSLAIKEEVQGGEHINVAQTLTNLASLLSMQGEYFAAHPLLVRALAIKSKTVGSMHPTYFATLNYLASVEIKLNNYERARHLCEGSLSDQKEVLGPDSPELALCMRWLATVYGYYGNNEKAGRMYERALAIMEKKLGVEHHSTGTIVFELASTYHSDGQFEKARPLLERCLAARQKAYGEKHIATVDVLNRLGLLLRDQGDLEGARQLIEQAKMILLESYGAENESLPPVLNNLASIYKSEGDFETARKLLERSLAIVEKHRGLDHPSAAVSLSNLAFLLRISGDFDDALPLLNRSLAITEKAFSPSHPSLRAVMSNLGRLHKLMGNFSDAQECLERALALATDVYGTEHLFTSLHQKNLGLFYQSQDQSEVANQHLQGALFGALQHLKQELPSMSEAGRLRLLRISANPNALLSCLIQTNRADLKEAYSLCQRWKGQATRLQVAGLRESQQSNLPSVREKKAKIQSLSNELSGLIILSLEEQGEDHSEKMEALRKQRILLEREFNRELGLDIALSIPDLQSVQNNLPADSVLVDFYVGKEVFAWVLKPEGQPSLISLGPSRAIINAQDEFMRTTAVRGGRTIAAVAGRELSSFLWLPLTDAVGDSNTVFVCPDGFLCELPFGLLLDKKGDFLLEKHRFIYQSDPSMFANMEDSSSLRVGPILAIGDVNYFVRGAAPAIERGVISTRSRVRNTWTSLPATRTEVQAIHDLHQYVLKWNSPITVIEGKAPTEERVRAELPGKRYVHIATHGYFEPDYLPSLLLDAEERQSDAQLGEQIQAVGLLPGLLSGLVFAGVNGDPDPTRDDGYLSAEEIQHLDLSACDLVVLSACETALGSARAGEGLMSLRRAFSVAGADAVISSLWKVDDKATAQLMKEFYTNLWEKNMSRGEALHQAKLRMLRRNRVENGGDTLPSTWGAFVLSGEWN
ncbi:MAG: CHAT domain-containing protein [Planctomycetes bacterium]|nr:CHAT domain-containing protein [Planctomycetota bacterium]